MLVQKIKMFYESSDELAQSIPDFFWARSLIYSQLVILSCHQEMVLLDVTNNSLVVAVVVLWISPLDSYIY